MARTNTRKDEKRVVTTVRASPSLLKQVAEVGRHEGRTRSNMIEIMLTEGVAKRAKAREKSLGVLG